MMMDNEGNAAEGQFVFGFVLDPFSSFLICKYLPDMDKKNHLQNDVFLQQKCLLKWSAKLSLLQRSSSVGAIGYNCQHENIFYFITLSYMREKQD